MTGALELYEVEGLSIYLLKTKAAELPFFCYAKSRFSHDAVQCFNLKPINNDLGLIQS